MWTRRRFYVQHTQLVLLVSMKRIHQQRQLIASVQIISARVPMVFLQRALIAQTTVPRNVQNAALDII